MSLVMQHLQQNKMSMGANMVTSKNEDVHFVQKEKTDSLSTSVMDADAPNLFLRNIQEKEQFYVRNALWKRTNRLITIF